MDNGIKAIQEVLSHFYLRLKKTKDIFVGRYKKGWTTFILEEIGVGICFSIGGFIMSGLDFDFVYLIKSASLGMALWIVVLGFFSFVKAPSTLFFEQKKQADLYTVNGIDISGVTPNTYDVFPCGISVTNKKELPIRVSVMINRVWQNRTEIRKGSLPKNLRWYLSDGSLSTGYETINPSKSLIIALEHVATEREKGAILIHAKSTSGKEEDFGEGVGLEFGDELGMSVFEKLPLRVELEFFFVINGLYLKPKHYFILSFTKGKLIAEKIGDWIYE